MLVISLTLLAAISAALHIRAEYRGPRRNVYLFKPLTMIFIILIALRGRHQTSLVYQYLIVAGLLCSLVGDIFLMLPADRFVPGLLSFLIAHLFYIAAFTIDGVHTLWPWLPFFLYGSVMLWVLLPYLGRLKIPVTIYMLVILIMAGQALSRYLKVGRAGNMLTLMGALLFVASDSMLALNRFKRHFHSAEFLILSTYFTAQWLIALSV